MANPWVRKSIAALKAEAAASEEHGLQRTLTGTNLIMLGIGAVIGAGFFGLTGEASAKYADFGPFIAGAVGTLVEVLDAAGVPD